MKPLQMSMRFLPEEDRLLLLIGTPQTEEYRFFITRRLGKSLLQALIQLMNAEVKLQEKEEPAGPINLKAAMVQYQHQQALSAGDFQKEFESTDASFPLGETPVLVTGFTLQQKDKGCVCVFRLSVGQDLTMNLPHQVIHCLYKLLADSIVKAEWDIDIAFQNAGEKPTDMSKLM